MLRELEQKSKERNVKKEPSPLCQDCQDREATGFIRIKERVALWLCGACWEVYHENGNEASMVGEPTKILSEGQIFIYTSEHYDIGNDNMSR
jgi:hypothetical protein